MTVQIENTPSPELISRLATPISDEQFTQEIPALVQLIKTLISSTVTQDVKKIKQQLSIIEGRLMALNSPEYKTVRQFRLTLSKKTYFETDVSKNMAHSLEIDSCITNSLWQTRLPFSENKHVEFSCGTLCLSHTLENSLTDESLLTLLHASSSHCSLDKVKAFDFSRCKKLSPEVPVKIKKLLPNLERNNFSCISREQFCDFTLNIQGEKIPINLPFLEMHTDSFLTHFKTRSVEQLKNFINYTIGKLPLDEMQDQPRLLEVMATARAFQSEVIFKEARAQFTSCLDSLGFVTYEWLDELNRAIDPSIKEVTKDISDRAFERIIRKAGGETNWAKINEQMERISDLSFSPMLSDICERLPIEQLIPNENRTTLFPIELEQFLEAMTKKYPENKMALLYLGRLHLVSWGDRAADKSKAHAYFAQVPASFCIEKNLFKWQ